MNRQWARDSTIGGRRRVTLCNLAKRAWGLWHMRAQPTSFAPLRVSDFVTSGTIRADKKAVLLSRAGTV